MSANAFHQYGKAIRAGELAALDLAVEHPGGRTKV